MIRHPSNTLKSFGTTLSEQLLRVHDNHYAHNRERLPAAAGELLAWVGMSKLKK